MSESFDSWSKLPRPTPTGDSRTLSVLEISPHGRYVGRAVSGRPVLVFASLAGARVRAPIVLRHIRTEFSVACELELGATSRRCQVTLVECLSDDPGLDEFFVAVSLRMFGVNSGPMDESSVFRSIESLVTLFERLQVPPSTVPQALFAELFLIDQSPDTASIIQAWRDGLSDHFDFNLGNLRVECKSSSTRRRMHSFSMEQCAPPAGVEAYAASMFVEQVGGGLSLGDLATRIASKCGAEGAQKVFLNVTATLGSSTAESLRRTYDEALAEQSLQLFDLRTVPGIRPPIPAGVSGIRFTSDLTACAPLPIETLWRAFLSGRV